MSEEESQSQYGQYSSDDNQSDIETNGPSFEDSSVQQQLILAQKYFDQDKYEDAKSQLDKIQTDDKREKYSILILRAFISLKNNDIDQFENYAIQASKEQREEILPYKIRIFNNRSLDELNKILTSMFNSNVKLDLEVMKLISPKMHKMAKKYKNIAKFYFDAIRDDKSLLPAIYYIIPTKHTVDDRIEILTKYSEDDMEACVLLIKIYIKEKGTVDKATPFIGYLPKDHPTRLLFKVLFGAHPVEKAKELCSQKDNDQHFRDFIKFYEEKNFISLQRFVQNEPYFASGWLLLAQLTDDIPSKCIALKKANEIFPKKEISNQLEELEGTCVIQNDNGEDIAITSSSKDRQELFEAKRYFDEYKKSKDKTVLKPILDMNDNFLIAEIKIEAIFELEDEIGTEEMMLKLESIKETKYRKIYNVIGHLYLKRGNQEEALNNFIEDAKFGSNDPVCLELVSRKFIQENEIEKALELCLRAPYHEWAIFRCGLIYQRLKNHEEAVKMFYKIIRNRQNLSSLTTTNSTDSDNGQNSRSIFLDEKIKIESVWKVIAQSYAAMNRYMALKDVLSELRKIGSPYLDYESLYSVFHEKKFGSEFSYDIISSPLQYHNFLRKILSDIKMLKWQGRIDSCIAIIEKYENLVVESLEKWGNLGAILKSSADFFLEGFILSDNQNEEMFQRSLDCYKNRAKIDLVPESFVDLANAFHVNEKDELALTTLKRSLTKFSNSQLIWFNIGILYALNEKFPLARHCFIVASKISFDSQNGKVFSYMAAVEQAMNDIEMMEKAIRAAEEMNSMDVSLLQIKSINGLLNPFDAAMSIYEGEFVSPELPSLCLKRGKFVEALGFALMLNSNDEIALAYEALGKYDQALQFAEDEELIERLKQLSELKSSPSEKVYSPDEIDSAINKYKEGEDLFSQLTTAALYISKNDKNEAYSILKSLLERSKNKSKKKTENANQNSNNASNDKNENDNNNNNNNANDSNNNNDDANDNNNNNDANDNNNNNDANDNNNNNDANDNNNNNDANVNDVGGNEKVDVDVESKIETKSNGNDVGDVKNNDETAAENDSRLSHLQIPKRFYRLILLWLIQVAPKDDNSITHKMINTDPVLFFMNAKRSVGECKAAVKMYHKFMNTNSFALKLFLAIALKSNDKGFNMAQIVGAAENLVSMSPSRDSYKFFISAKIKDKKYKEAMDAIQRLQILDPNETKQYSELFNQLKSIS